MIEIFSKDFEYLGIIDIFVGAKVEKVYRNLAKFNIDFNSFEYAEILQVDNYVLFDNEPYIIKKISHYKSLDNELTIKVSGFSADYFLEDRILIRDYKIRVDVSYEQAIYVLITDNLINPENPKRKIDIIKNAPMKNLNVKSQTEYTLKAMSLREAVTLLCSYAGLGYRMNFKDTYLEFEVYQGKYLTDSVIFSEEFNNIADTEVTTDIGNVKNVVYKVPEDTGIPIEFDFYKDIEETGINRKEVILSEEDKTKANEVLNLSNDTVKVQTLVAPNSQFEYKIDWNLGDIVLFEDIHFGFTSEQPIVQVIEYLGANGQFEIEIKFGEKKPIWQI